MFSNKKEKQNKRFKTVYNQSLGFGGVQIIVDTVTGVNYLNTIDASISGVTPLVDADGNVVVSRDLISTEN